MLLSKSHKTDIFDNYLFIIGLFSTFSIITVSNQPVFLWLSIAGIPLSLICIRGKRRIISVPLLLLSIAMLMSSLFSWVNINPTIGTISIRSSIYVILILLFANLTSVSESEFKHFYQGVIWSCRIQMLWCILQLVLYYFFGLDINDYLFREVFGLTEVASRYRGGALVASGLCWHPGNLIPVFLVSAIFNISLWEIIIWIFIAAESQSTTFTIAVILFLIYKVIIFIRRAILDYRFKHSALVAILLIPIIFSLFIYFQGGLFDGLVNSFSNLFNRLFNPYYQIGIESTEAHISYYTLYPDILKRQNLGEFLFGYGFSNSGFPFSRFYGQYTNFGNWNVESNLMDSVYGIGILGTVMFYYWYFRFIMHSFHLNSNFAALLILLFVCGLTYNNQFTWVLLLEFFGYFYLKAEQSQSISSKS